MSNYIPYRKRYVVTSDYGVLVFLEFETNWLWLAKRRARYASNWHPGVKVEDTRAS